MVQSRRDLSQDEVTNARKKVSADFQVDGDYYVPDVVSTHAGGEGDEGGGGDGGDGDEEEEEEGSGDGGAGHDGHPNGVVSKLPCFCFSDRLFRQRLPCPPWWWWWWWW